MSEEHERVVPYRIAIEWVEDGDFHFSCDYKPEERSRERFEEEKTRSHRFPHMVRAMGNVLKKLRREHITFPLFLLALAFEHRHLLREIDDLLQALHRHLASRKGSGTYRCFITGGEPVSCREESVGEARSRNR